MPVPENTSAEALDRYTAGYSNPSHFAQLFRKETGLSPTIYRRQR
jgi:AraC-like DNA-binding protein